MQSEDRAALRLRAVMQADPSALVRVLQFFQDRNIVPVRVASERMGDSYVQISIELDSGELAPDAFRVVVAKIRELPIVVAVVSC